MNATAAIDRPRRLALLSLGGVAFAISACDVTIGPGEDGSGVAETVVYEFDDFDQISVGGAFEADITVGDGPTSIEVTVDDNLVDDLDVEVDDGRLEIGWKQNINPDVQPTVAISVPNLTAVDISGATEATIVGVDAEVFSLDGSGASDIEAGGDFGQLELDLSGASNLELDGTVDEMTADFSGASSADLTEVEAGGVALDLSGASSVQFESVGPVSGEISGASELTVPDGVPLEVETSGASSIKRG